MLKFQDTEEEKEIYMFKKFLKSFVSASLSSVCLSLSLSLFLSLIFHSAWENQ